MGLFALPSRPLLFPIRHSALAMSSSPFVSSCFFISDFGLIFGQGFFVPVFGVGESKI
jgi:hypothetical protein